MTEWNLSVKGGMENTKRGMKSGENTQQLDGLLSRAARYDWKCSLNPSQW